MSSHLRVADAAHQFKFHPKSVFTDGSDTLTNFIETNIIIEISVFGRSLRHEV